MRKDDRRTSTCGLFTCKLVVYESTMLLSRNCSKYMTSCEKGSDTIESIENSNLRKARFIIFHYNQSKQSSALSTYSSTPPVEKSFTESLDFSFYHGLCLSHTATLPLRNMSRCRRHATWILSFRLSWPRWPVRRYFEKTPSIHGIFQVQSECSSAQAPDAPLRLTATPCSSAALCPHLRLQPGIQAKRSQKRLKKTMNVSEHMLQGY